jgi:hypothetical protein
VDLSIWRKRKDGGSRTVQQPKLEVGVSLRGSSKERRTCQQLSDRTSGTSALLFDACGSRLGQQCFQRSSLLSKDANDSAGRRSAATEGAKSR